MYKKLKMWLFAKMFKDVNDYYLKVLKNNQSEIKNLKKQINFLTMKGPLL